MKIRFAALAAASLLAFPATGGVIPGFEIAVGPEVFYHYYEEPGLMRNYGPQFGAYGSAAYLGLSRVRLAMEASFAAGRVTYDGAYGDGTPLKDDVRNSILHLRTRAGWDFNFSLGRIERIRLTPYAGAGYRYLVNRLDDLGQGGYKREQTYYYLPAGIELFFQVPDVPYLTLGFQAEFDFFLRGKHTAGPIVGWRGDRAKNFTQDSGWGLRLSHRQHWAVFDEMDLFLELYFQYWDVDDSTRLRQGLYTWWEPANTTSEAGLRLGAAF